MRILAVILIIAGLIFGISGLFDLVVNSVKFVFYILAILLLVGGIGMMFRRIKS
ncbi:hypothetical protein ACLBWT_10550 [Paenibacillus sp. D51F]